jgi:hypothetical protein
MSTKGGAGTYNVITIPSIELYTGYTESGSEPTGAMFWDSINNTVSIVLEDGVILQTGKETYFNVLNQTGSDFSNGQVIAYAGAVGASGKIKGQLGLADGSIEYYKHLGIATKNIPNGESGEVTILGAVHGIDTTGTPYGEVWNQGDILYVSPTIAGGLTNIEPVAPFPLIGIAVVINVHQKVGTLGVRTTFLTRVTVGDQIASGETGSVLFVNGNSQLTQDNDGLYWNNSTGVLQVGSRAAGNYSEIEADGSYHMVGDATVWNDVNIGGLVLSGPAVSKADIEEILDNTGAGTGIYTSAFDIDEKGSGALEIPHSYKEGSDFQFHLHWSGNDAPSGMDYVRWKLDYTIINAGGTMPPATTVEFETAYDTQYERADSSVMIDGTGITICNQLCFTLTRIMANGDAYAGDALVETIGIHFEEDTIGSRQIMTK